jgi:hypothetical protein
MKFGDFDNFLSKWLKPAASLLLLSMIQKKLVGCNSGAPPKQAFGAQVDSRIHVSFCLALLHPVPVC